MTLTNVLSQTNSKTLLRALNSQKNYLYFDISVFNVGASINIICTNIFKETIARTWNGYDFIVENDYATKFYITNELNSRL